MWVFYKPKTYIMSAYGRRNRGRRPIGYFAEFLIIIAGVTVSFFLNEWRESNKMEEKKISLLHEISHDLVSDTILLSFSVDLYKNLLSSHDSLLKQRNEDLSSDSLDIYVDQVASYFPFKETQNTYLKITSDPNLVINKEDTLIERFLLIHNQLYNMSHEWTSIEKDFVLNQLIPYMDMHAPFLYPPPHNKSFQGEVFNKLKEKDVFMNLLKTGRSYKSAILQVNQAVLAQVTRFKLQVDTYLEQVEE